MASTSIRSAAAAAFRAGRTDDALALLEDHCHTDGDSAAWLALGRLKQHLGDLRGARSALETAAQWPDPAFTAHRALAHVLVDAGEADAACTLLIRSLADAPTEHPLWTDLGIAQERAAQLTAALASYGRALDIAPLDPRARLNRAALLRAQLQPEAALADYDALLAHSPSQASWWYERGECLRQCRRYDQAVASCERALALEPRMTRGAMCKAVALASMGAIDAAQQSFDMAFSWDREQAARYGNDNAPLREGADARSVYLAAAFARLNDADWQNYTELLATALNCFANASHAPRDLSGAFPLLYLPLPNAVRSAGHIAISRALQQQTAPHPRNPRRAEQRLRIGYLSSKFRDHPSMVLTGGLFRAHDRQRLEVFGYALNGDDKSSLRQRIQAEFDHFVELSMLDDGDAARRIRDDGIDILVDLNGYSDEARPQILALRPAALQMTYLGHSHSLFAPWIDYRITDRVSEPEDWGQALCEARAFMPASFYPYDTARNTPGHRPSRAALGLPEAAFVLCGFTRTEKIEPRLLARWLDLLQALPTAVLWLGPASTAARTALPAQAVAQDIAAERLIFVERVDHATHLARHRAADLFLDTWTFNAHTTGLDALQAGLPMVSLKGAAWSSRYGASLLSALGLEELIVTTPQDYCDLVIALAHDRPRLLALRSQLEQRITRANPFAPDRMARHLGAIYTHAWARYVSGAPVADFDIT